MPDEILVDREELREFRKDVMNLNQVGPLIAFPVWIRVATTVNSWMVRPSAYVKPSQLEFSELMNRVFKLEKAVQDSIPAELNNHLRYIISLQDDIIKLMEKGDGT